MQVNATITQSADKSVKQITELSACLLIFTVLRAMFIIFGLKSIIEQLLNLVYGFLHLKCIIKQLLDSVFVICKIINVSVRVISLAFGTADNAYIVDIYNSAHMRQISGLGIWRGVECRALQRYGGNRIKVQSAPLKCISCF